MIGVVGKLLFDGLDPKDAKPNPWIMCEQQLHAQQYQIRDSGLITLDIKATIPNAWVLHEEVRFLSFQGW